MKMKRIAVFAMAAVLSLSAMPMTSVKAVTENEPQSDILFEDFDGDSLDSSKWLIANKQWGGKNGGVVKENVSVSDGTLKLEGHGLKYSGDGPSVGKYRTDGKLTGAAIATRDYYASGSYEVVAKVAPDLGACSALWTFEYEEYYPGDENYDPKHASWGYTAVNHEIDIEIPTGTSKHPDPNFSAARFNTYVFETQHTSHFHDLAYAQNDGKFHTYRFDWHTGDEGEQARVDFYIDGEKLYTSTKDIPYKAGRFWIAVWFPYSNDSDGDGVEDTGWSGLADFDTTVFEVDSVKITPFHEAGDREQEETFAYDGWAPNSFPELYESERYEHVVNGDFSEGEKGWTIGDEAVIEGGVAKLHSGQVADTVSQIVKAMPAATYTVTADVVTNGAKVTIGASKQNGSNDHSMTVTKSGKVKITFNNETANTELKVYAKVDRWQQGDVKVSVDNISLVGASYVESTVTEFVPAEGEDIEDPGDSGDPGSKDPITPDPGDGDLAEKVNLVQNATFDQGTQGWNLSGSTRVENGAAYLASGKDVDSISQKIQVEKGATYTLSADITSNGAGIEFGVKDYDGKYTKCSETYTEDGKYQMTFKVADHMDQIEVFASVDRYQENGEDCSIDNIVLVKGTEAGTVEDGSGKEDAGKEDSGKEDIGEGGTGVDMPEVDVPGNDDSDKDKPGTDEPGADKPDAGLEAGSTDMKPQTPGQTEPVVKEPEKKPEDAKVETEKKQKKQKITTAKMKKIKAKTLKKKSVKIKLKAKSDGKGKLTYKVYKYPKKMKKYIKVSKKGTVTLKKNAKKGTYKIKITAAAKGDYIKTIKVVSIKVK